MYIIIIMENTNCRDVTAETKELMMTTWGDVRGCRADVSGTTTEELRGVAARF